MGAQTENARMDLNTLPKNICDTQLFIEGEPVDTAERTPIFDPARPSIVIGTAAAASHTQVNQAIESARGGFVRWSRLSQDTRRSLIAEALDACSPVLDNDAELLSLETGKIVQESRIDFAVFLKRFRLALSLHAETLQSRMLEPTDLANNRTEVSRKPLGVVTIIVPFNWPLAILAASLPQVLIAGNAAIVKPPYSAPLALTRFLHRFAARLPAGVLNIVSGDNAAVEPLISHVEIAKVCFTGSVSAGKRIMQLAAKSLTRVTLELGGNDAAVILNDAPLDDTHLDRLFSSIFDTSGQICMNAKRIYVQEKAFSTVVDGLESRLAQVQLGHGLDPNSTHGPLHSRDGLELAQAMKRQATDSGAEVHEFGVLPSHSVLKDGYFMRPAVVLNPDEQLDIVQKEQFAPIIPIMSCNDVDEMVHRANNSWAGLGASVWTANRERAAAIADQLEAGYVWINDHGAPRLDLRAPFGGVKQSGFGREQGISGLLEFSETHAVAHDLGSWS